MSAIAGALRLDGAPLPDHLLATMVATQSHRAPDGSAIWRQGAVGLAHGAAHTTPEAHTERHPLSRGGADLTLVADARIDNGGELRRCLGLPAGTGDGTLILASYERWGSACVDHLVGDFAFALWDGRSRSLFCARDPFGVKPLYWFHSPRLFAFASEIKALLATGEVPTGVDADQLRALLDATVADRTRTVYREVRRLPAAHTLTVRSSSVTVSRYWRPAPDRELHFARDEEYVEAFRDCFVEAVRCRLRTQHRIGAALSGGLDSSSIVCVARRELQRAGGAPLHTFSLVFPGLPSGALRLIDERKYMDAVIDEGGLVPHAVRGDRLSPLRELDRVLWHLDAPHLAPNLYLHWGMFEAARASGVRIFLDGFDGDTTVSHGLGRLQTLLRAGRWDAFEAEVRGFAEHREMSPQQVLPRFGFPWLLHLARRGRLLSWTRAASELSRRFALSRRSVLTHYGLAALSRAGAAAAPATERETHLQAIEHPLLQLSLELADHATAAFGIEARYPFFDRRLVECCLAMPEEQKFARGWSRYAFRRAMAGIVPPAVQWRGGKGNLSPNFAHRLREADLARVRAAPLDLLESFTDVRSLVALRDRVTANPTGTTSDDELRLFRASIMATWLAAGEGAPHVRHLSRARPVDDAFPIVA